MYDANLVCLGHWVLIKLSNHLNSLGVVGNQEGISLHTKPLICTLSYTKYKTESKHHLHRMDLICILCIYIYILVLHTFGNSILYTLSVAILSEDTQRMYSGISTLPGKCDDGNTLYIVSDWVLRNRTQIRT